jgi:GT2 family glycosyltransferase
MEPTSRPGEPSLDVVVVIPSFNQSRLLAECLASVEAEIRASGLAAQIVVVDNASWDDSAAMVASRFPGVTLLENDVNAGFSVACNQGGKVYLSRYVVLLNNDATLEPGALRALVELADARPKLGGATGRLLSPEGRERYPARHLGDRLFGPPKRPHELTWVPGTATLLRREALDAVGWLDEAFFFYNEDLDLSIRLRKGGWSLWYTPAAVFRHHEGGSSKLIRSRATLEGYRGALLLAKKHYGKPAYAATRIGLRLDVKARLAFLRLLGLMKRGDLGVAARVECYEAVREVLRHEAAPPPPAEIEARSEG